MKITLKVTGKLIRLKTLTQEVPSPLEEEIVPLFYHRGRDGLPRGWVGKMKDGLRRLVPIFNSHRMVQEYVSRYYLPSSRRFNALCADDYKGARDLSVWRQKLMTGWHEVAVVEVSADGSIERSVGQQIQVAARVRLGTLSPEDVIVEAYYGRLDQNGDFAERETVRLELVDSADGLYGFLGKIPCRETGSFGYTVRVMPSHKRLENRFVMGLVIWA